MYIDTIRTEFQTHKKSRHLRTNKTRTTSKETSRQMLVCKWQLATWLLDRWLGMHHPAELRTFWLDSNPLHDSYTSGRFRGGSLGSDEPPSRLNCIMSCGWAQRVWRSQCCILNYSMYIYCYYNKSSVLICVVTCTRAWSSTVCDVHDVRYDAIRTLMTSWAMNIIKNPKFAARFACLLLKRTPLSKILDPRLIHIMRINMYCSDAEWVCYTLSSSCTLWIINFCVVVQLSLLYS